MEASTRAQVVPAALALRRNEVCPGPTEHANGSVGTGAWSGVDVPVWSLPRI